MDLLIHGFVFAVVQSAVRVESRQEAQARATSALQYSLALLLNHLQIMRIAHDMRRQSVMIQSFNARQFCLIGKQLSAEFQIFKIR